MEHRAKINSKTNFKELFSSLKIFLATSHNITVVDSASTIMIAKPSAVIITKRVVSLVICGNFFIIKLFDRNNG